MLCTLGQGLGASNSQVFWQRPFGTTTLLRRRRARGMRALRVRTRKCCKKGQPHVMLVIHMIYCIYIYICTYTNICVYYIWNAFCNNLSSMQEPLKPSGMRSQPQNHCDLSLARAGAQLDVCDGRRGAGPSGPHNPFCNWPLTRFGDVAWHRLSGSSCE